MNTFNPTTAAQLPQSNPVIDNVDPIGRLHEALKAFLMKQSTGANGPVTQGQTIPQMPPMQSTAGNPYASLYA